MQRYVVVGGLVPSLMPFWLASLQQPWLALQASIMMGWEGVWKGKC
jgi:hypothetical protein